jgi:hypothetical protein
MQSDRDWFDWLRNVYEADARSSRYFEEELKVFDERSAFSFYEGLNPVWLMEHAERAAMFLLMTRIRPQVVIEIGARYAGATYLFAQFARKVYAIDIDPAVVERCSHLKNVEVLLGDSQELIPRLLDKLEASGEGWDFALVDGDHSADAVRKDLNALLARRPIRRAWISMHDSFNPECRRGIRDANWSQPWVHHVELDFVPGQLMWQPHVERNMWGGVSLAEIRPEDRKTATIGVRENSRLLFEAALKDSVYAAPPEPETALIKRAIRKISRMVSQ